MQLFFGIKVNFFLLGPWHENSRASKLLFPKLHSTIRGDLRAKITLEMLGLGGNWADGRTSLLRKWS